MEIDIVGDKDKFLKFLRPEKKVVAKTTKDKMFLSLKRQRTTKPKSQIQKMSDAITAKKLKNFDEIRDYLLSKYTNVKEKTINFLSAIAKSRVINGRINLTDSFANTPIIYRIACNAGNTQWLSNDILFIAFFMRCLVKGLTCIPLDSRAKIKYMKVVSPPFLAEGEIKRGFIQDGSPYFFAYGVSGNANFDDFFKFEKPYRTFSYDGYTYDANMYNGGILICKNDMRAKAKELYEGQKTFSFAGNKRELKEKSIEIKSKPRFIQNKLIPDSFCSAYVQYPASVPITVEFSVNIDYNSMFDGIIAYAKANAGAISFNIDFINWYNLQAIMDMFAALAIVGPSFGLPNDTAQFCGKIVDYYNNYRIVFECWGKNQKDLERLTLDFYNSFNTKIQFDKMSDMKKTYANLFAEYEELLDDESYELARTFFNSDEYLGKWNCCIKNQMNKNYARPIYSSVLEMLTAITKSQSNLLIDKLKKVANTIYNATSTNFQETKCLFNKIISPGAFFGDGVVGQLERNTYVDEIVKDYLEGSVKKSELERAVSSNVEDILNNITIYRQQVISNNVDKYMAAEGENIKEKGYDVEKVKLKLKDFLNSLLNTNKEAMNVVNKAIANVRPLNAENVKSVDLGKEWMDGYVREILSDMKIEIDTKSIDKKMESLKKEKDFLSMSSSKGSKKRIFGRSLGKGYSGEIGDYRSMSVIDEIPDIDEMSSADIRTHVVNPEKTEDGTKYDFGEFEFITEDGVENNLSKWITHIIARSGMFNDYIVNDKMVELMMTEDPAKLSSVFPIAAPVMTYIRKKLKMPTMDTFVQGKADIPEVKKDEMPDELAEKLKGINAYILSNSSGTGADAIKAENSFNVKKMLLGYKDDYNNASKSLYPKLGSYVKELRSYKNALEAK